MYLYGLTAEEIPVKINPIYDVYVKKLPSFRSKILVFKSTKIVTISANPAIRLCIMIKVKPLPTDISLDIGLDICTIGCKEPLGR